MKQYLVFVYARYYPEGGWEDYVGIRGTVTAAKVLAASKLQQMRKARSGDLHYHIVEMSGSTTQIVDAGGE